jgi:guanylate kinase
MEGIARRGLMLVLSSPSGAGKTTLARRLLDDEHGGVAMSISHTTRPQRKGEKDGRDYHFVDHDTFTQMRDQGAFLEWAVVFDNYYGTTRQPVEQALAAGRDVLFDVDWQGAAALRAKAENDVVTVFILPPTAAALERRLN